MIILDKAILSDDIKYVCFSCDLEKCKGACCEEGDCGAPLDDEEIGIMEDLIDEVKPYMEKEGLEIIERDGVFDVDFEGDFVTPLVNFKQCAYVYYENEIAFCAIEKAFLEGKIKFRKPLSCHLYPIRIKKHDTFDAINYHRWEICSHAREKGDAENIPLYKYLKEPLVRCYGEDWYNTLCNEINSKP